MVIFTTVTSSTACGSGARGKAHRALIAALARIRDLDWEMLCIGSLDRDPRTARSIRQMISAACLGRRITLAGEQPPRMVMRAYREADLFVLPSLHEGYGMVFAEAMAHGLPIIATAAGAIPETVPREAGLLVRPGDAAALARALRRVIASRRWRCVLRQAHARRCPLPGLAASDGTMGTGTGSAWKSFRPKLRRFENGDEKRNFDA